MGTWTPASLPSLWLWLEARRGTYEDSAFATPAKDDGDPVGGWLDASAQNNRLNQSVAPRRPTLRKTGGVWCVRGDGADDYLAGTVAAVLKPVTVVAAINLDSLGLARVILGPTVAGGTTFQISAAGLPFLRKNGGGTGTVPATPVPTGVWIVLSATWAADNTTVYRMNGVQIATGTNNPDTPVSSAASVLAEAVGPANFFPGNLGGVVVATSVLSAADIAATEAYLTALVAPPPDPFSALITQGRALVVDLALPDVCEIERLTRTETSGGVSETWQVIDGGVPCRYSESPTQADQLIAARTGTVVEAVLAVPALTDVTAEDRVHLTVGGVDFGRFMVSDVVRRSREVQRRVYVRQA